MLLPQPFELRTNASLLLHLLVEYSFVTIIIIIVTIIVI